MRESKNADLPVVEEPLTERPTPAPAEMEFAGVLNGLVEGVARDDIADVGV